MQPRRHRPGEAARRLAGAGRRGRSTRPATGRCSRRSWGSPLPLDADDRVRDVRRQRGQPPLRQPLPRHRPRRVDRRAARRAEEVRGHPVGEHDRLGLARQGALRRHRLDPERAQLEGAGDCTRALGARPSRPSGCRSSTARARHARPAPTRTRSCPGSSARRACRRCSAATTSTNSNDSYWLTNPPSRSRASRGSSATRARPQDAAHEARPDDAPAAARRHRRVRRRQVQPQQAAADRVQRPPLRRGALPLHARLLLPLPPGARQLRRRRGRTSATPARRWTASTRSRTSTAPARSSSAGSCPTSAPRRTRRRSTSATRSTRRRARTADPAVGTALADAVTDLSDAGIPFDAPLGQYQYSRAGPRTSRSTAAPTARAPST